jgi:hypothetical protein
MRIIGPEVLPYLVRPDSQVQDGGEVGRRTSTRPLHIAPTVSVDHVELSSHARDVQRLHQLIRDTPEVRAPRVAEAQHALTTQTLPLDGQTLAPKLLADALITATSR